MITNNGMFSRPFPISIGVRQGCPLSPYPFVFCVEVLANSLKNNLGVKCINISETEFLISQYADDTTFFLDGKKSPFKNLISTLNCFRRFLL